MAPDAQAKQKDFQVQLFNADMSEFEPAVDSNKRCLEKELQAEFRLPFT